MPSDYVIVLTTLPSDADFTDFAETLVREHLAACVNVLPEMQSIYWWKGGVETGRERQVLIKTATGRLDAVQARIAALHPHEVPELLVLKIDGGGDKYLKWMGEATS